MRWPSRRVRPRCISRLLPQESAPATRSSRHPITWPATANVIVHTGATPVFCDVRDSDLNIDPEAVEAAATGRTRAVMPVDLAGQPSDLEPIMSLARERGWLVVEDAAHAVESEYRGQKVGAVADATCFSLYATKNVAAGEGGVITTDLDDLADEVRELRLMRRGNGSLYDIRTAGFKANLADVNAAIALCQLDKLEQHRQIRLRHVAAYDEAIADLEGIEPLVRDPRDTHALHLYVVRIDPERAGASRDDYQEALAAENIGTSIHFLPVHRLTYYREHVPTNLFRWRRRPARRCCRSRSRPRTTATTSRRDRGTPARAPEVCRPVSRLPRPASISLKILLPGGVILLRGARVLRSSAPSAVHETVSPDGRSGGLRGSDEDRSGAAWLACGPTLIQR